jgi:hypothetical protein
MLFEQSIMITILTDIRNSKIAKKWDCDWAKIFQNRANESETKIIEYISEYDAISYLSRYSTASCHDSKIRFAGWNQISAILMSSNMWISWILRPDNHSDKH